MDLQTLLRPQRADGETFKAYKARRSSANRYLKESAKGRLVWNSYQRGTYIKAKHGEL